MAQGVTIDFNANIAKFTNAVDKMSDRLDKFQSNTQKRIKSLTKVFGGLAAAFSVSAISNFTRETLAAADEIAKTADKIGITTDKLQELRYAAELTGGSQKALDTAMQRFSRRVGEAAQGTGVLAKEFEKYGISLTTAEGRQKSLQELLGDYADAVQNAGTAQEQLRLTVAAFDSEGAPFVNLLRNGRKGLDDLGQSFRDAGGALDESLVRSAEEINDKFTELTTKIGTRLKGAVLEVAAAINSLGSGGSDFKFGDDLEASRARAAEIKKEMDALGGSTRTSRKRIAELRSELERIGETDPYTARENALNRILDLEERIGEAGNERGRNRAGASAGLVSQLNEEQSKLKEIDAAIAKYEASVNRASTNDLNTSGSVNNLVALQNKLNETKNAATDYAETLKLFQAEPAKPFTDDASNAEKTLSTYRKISEALSALNSGDQNAGDALEKAASAVNQLAEDGAAASVTLDSMKAALQQAYEAAMAGEDGQSPSIQIKATVDKDGVLQATNDATQAAIAQAQANPIIIPVRLDVTSVGQQISDAASIAAAAAAAGGRP